MKYVAPEQRMFLWAISNNQPFYYRLGFRVVDIPQMNEVLAKMDCSKKPEKEFEDCEMMLPKSAQKLWQKELFQTQN